MTLLPHWNEGSVFRRYLLFAETPTSELIARLTAHVLRLPTASPYVRWQHQGGLILVPKRNDLEKFMLLPGARLVYARTRRDEAHDAALVQALRCIDAELRLVEHERGMKPYELARIYCDDCGAHPKHRSRRLIRPPWPVQDGTPCSNWVGGKYNVTYG